ncbi:hypothetical protein GII36_01365 [Candidatus Mycosynbacter amalyticus]|uniref:Periplasmic copper-binding protein NosD beta helix domain-containing protein n=1 Tax=Candidatus Mycosynbacter amalyticus TaxID=2665156 RepID=A0A857ML36_9BACT|nr:right-handed parallel beta-helix repeat-containing protein [Candidatus Mycosynbacter amalyticus]QHN42495.1 hypothetical protein GII36_01365 [Candidatus Mycosynbacter amalyticus]
MGLAIKSKRRGGLILTVIAAFALVAQPMYGLIADQVAHAAGNVTINEVSSASSPEWVELYAPADTNLAGWVVQFDANDGTAQKKILTSADVTDANGLFVVETTTTWLTNTGDVIKLYDGTTLKQTVTVPNLTAAQSYRADYDGASAFAISGTPTKGITNGTAPALTLAQRVAAAAPGDTIDITNDEVIPSQVVITKPLIIKSSTGAKLSTPNALTGILGIQSNNVTIDGLIFESNFDIGESQVVRGLEISSYTGITVKNNRFLNLRQPAYINDNAQVTVINNYTNQTKGWVILSNSNVSFSGNTWGTNVLDIAIIAGATNNYSDAQVVAMSDTNADAVVENQFGGSKRLSDAYVTQTSNGNSGDEGSKWNPYTSIQSGVGRIVPGGTVHVANGTYSQSTSVDKSATVKAESQAARVIGGPSYNDTAFRVAAPNVTIDGFSIGDTSSMVGTVGVDLGGSAGAVVKNNVIEHNQRGISLAGASNVTLDSNTVRDNNANPENNAGIWGDAVSGITIVNSAFSGASNTSINLAGSSNIVLSRNTFTSGANAAVLWGDSNVTLQDNLLSGLSSTGFFVTGTIGLNATNNTLTASTTGKSAFSISTASGAQSSDITLTGNKITGYTNGLNVGSGSFSGTVAATKNWWGSATGPQDTNSTDGSTPAANAAGTGVAVNGAARYGSWCLSVACTDFYGALTAPTNLTPPAGAFTRDRGFSMTWNVVPGASIYEYRTANTLVDATTLGPIIYSDNSASSNYSVAGGKVTRGNSGTPDADYYWQVRAGDGSGSWGPWSAISKVTVDNVAPTSTNDLASLVRGSLIIHHTITDNTQPASGKLRIWKQNSDGSLDNSKFYASANAVATDSAGVATYALNTASQLYGDGKYTAKFTSRDAAGNESVQEKVFTVDNTAPTVTVKSGAIGNTTSKIFSNVSLSLYDAYQVDRYVLNGQMVDFTNNTYSDANFQNIKSKLVQGSNTFVLYDVAGNTTTYVFNYDTVAPAAPTHQSPGADTIQSSNDFWFDWSDVSDAVSYEMQNSQNPAIGADGSFTNVQWTGDYQQIQPIESQARSVGANGTWYWQVRAVDAAGNKSTWTAPWKVTIDHDAPHVPVDLTWVAQGGASVTSGNATNVAQGTLGWNHALSDSDVDHYKYYFWTNIPGYFNGQANAWSTSDASYFTNSSIGGSIWTNFDHREGTYYFCVKAIDFAGNESSCSDTFSILYDATAPIAHVTASSYDAAAKQLTVQGDTSDTTDEVTVEYAGASYVATVDSDKKWTVTIPTPASPDGQVVTAFARDTAGNVTNPGATHTVAVAPAAEPSGNINGGQSDGSGEGNGTTAQRSVVTTLPSVLGAVLPVFIVSATTPTVATTLPTGNVAVDSAQQATVLGSETTSNSASGGDDESNVKGAADEKTSANWFATNWWWLVLLLAAIGGTWWLLVARRRRVAENA